MRAAEQNAPTKLHPDPHPRAGETVRLKLAEGVGIQLLREGAEMRIGDWWDRDCEADGSLQENATPATIMYEARAEMVFDRRFRREPGADPVGLSLDPAGLVYGHVGPFGYVVHESELV